MTNQYVYILSNEFYPDDIFYIGSTKRHPSLRAQELYTSSVPSPFTVEYVIVTSNVGSLEKNIYAYLDVYRMSPIRKFFKINKMNLRDILSNNMHLNLITIDELDAHLGDTSRTIPVEENVTTEVRPVNQRVSAFLDEIFESCDPTAGHIYKKDVSMLFAYWCEQNYGETYHNMIQDVFDGMTEKYGDLKELSSPGWIGVQQIRDNDRDPVYLFGGDKHFCDCGKMFKTIKGINNHESICSVYQKFKSKQEKEMLCAFIKETFEPCEPNPYDHLQKSVVQRQFADWYNMEYGKLRGNLIQKVYDTLTEKFGEIKKYPSPGWEGVRVITCDYSV